ncbi:hypothetical protein MCZ36_15150 [Bacillus safensis]|nr:hypothetical protein [Bacillus altitudinis]MCY7446318.1 hypothetical protein [Bacillus safensis]TYS31810.1 DUF3810 domain-containing protein [Bacillus pumilus]KLV22766.1 hypothetical protein ABW03_09180 [Bacillus altitudinis]MCY7459127.1 hypothetical protein [Bacillus safensis]TYS47449.1 DUF3810 domain-containing protein [Bacillus pumilus]
MVLMRLISLYMITIAVLAIVANFFPFLAWPIYILAIVGLIFCLGNIIYHLILKKRRNLHR